MKTAVVRAFGLFVSVLVSAVASAQSTQAVEWKVSDGGNGHWYQRLNQPGGITWSVARDRATGRGGHLATVASPAENAFIFGVCGSAWSNRQGPWLGGYQVPGSVEPSGGWGWVTGEPWLFASWDSGQPDSGCPNTNENALHFINFGPNWNDINESGWCGSDGPIDGFMVEWDADCNGDGIIDYGQIHRGELADLNTNNIPDVCEVSVSGVTPPSVPAQGGSTVTIRGTNFQGTPNVLIGGVPATNVVTVSPISLTATSPALLPGMVSVTVNGFTLQDAIYIRPQCGSDLDQDGEVTAADIAIVLLDFGPCYSNAAAPEPDSSTPFMLREEAAPAAPQSR